MAEFYRFEIQKEILRLLRAGPFYKVNYDATTKAPTTDEVHVTPEVVVNEVSSGFDNAVLNKREHAMERTGWQFQAMVGFNCEVIAEAFERSVTRPIPKLPRDASVGRPQQVDIRLISAAYEHPVQQDGSSGSRISYVFEARLSPI